MSSKPEEDDDDWFTKDIDDFDVPDIKKPSEGDAEAETGTSLLESLKIKPKQFFDGECFLILIMMLKGLSRLCFYRHRRKLFRSIFDYILGGLVPDQVSPPGRA